MDLKTDVRVKPERPAIELYPIVQAGADSDLDLDFNSSNSKKLLKSGYI